MSDYLSKWKMYVDDYNSGMSYSEIAAKYGVSRQCVERTCKKERRFEVKPSSCVFVNLRNWMNENEISKTQLVKMTKASYSTLDRYLKGEIDIPRRFIDNLIEITGIPYEELFVVG